MAPGELMWICKVKDGALLGQELAWNGMSLSHPGLMQYKFLLLSLPGRAHSQLERDLNRNSVLDREAKVA